MPQGPQGDPGLSAYEVWKQAVLEGNVIWSDKELTLSDYFRFLKGRDGRDGANAYEVWKSFIADGKAPDPHNPGSYWSSEDNTEYHFWLYLTGKPGADGHIPYIGENGNWYINGNDTQVPAKGKDGKDGKDGRDGKDGKDGKDGRDGIDGKDGKNGKDGANGQDGKIPYVGANGNWHIDGKDSGVPVAGVGKSAYELWKEDLALNCGKTTQLMDPHNDGQPWPCDRNSIADFWEFLRGRDGSHSSIVISDYILSFVPLQTEKDAVGYDVITGDVIINVKDRDNKPVPTGSKIEMSTAFGLKATMTFEVEANSNIRVARNLLPANATELAKRSARAKVILANGSTYNTNIFSMPTQVKVVEVDGSEADKISAQWSVYNDWAEGLIRVTPKLSYIIDAAGPTSTVELQSTPTVHAFGDIFVKWYNAKSVPEFTVRLNIVDELGNILHENDPRVYDAWYARHADNSAVARRHLMLTTPDATHKEGKIFAHHQFSNAPYYVQSKAAKHYFGIDGTFQSPIIKVPPMPRVPLIKAIRFEEMEAIMTFNNLSDEHLMTLAGAYKYVNGKLEPTLESLKDMNVHITFTAKNEMFSAKTVVNAGETIEVKVPIPAAKVKEKGANGYRVLISAPSDFLAANADGSAWFKNQHQHMFCAIMGVTTVVTPTGPDDTGCRVKFSSGLGYAAGEEYVPTL